MSELVELCALWKKQSKDGKTTYLEGRLGNAVVVAFVNENANEENRQPFIKLNIRNFVKNE